MSILARDTILDALLKCMMMDGEWPREASLDCSRSMRPSVKSFHLAVHIVAWVHLWIHLKGNEESKGETSKDEEDGSQVGLSPRKMKSPRKRWRNTSNKTQTKMNIIRRRRR